MEKMLFDMLRKRYVALIRIEWVRQHFVHYLTDYKGYPKGLLGQRNTTRLKRNKNVVILCSTTKIYVKLIVEYKAPHIEITQTVFDQITRYNMVLRLII